MNKIYKVIFNRNKNRYEIVSELASSRGGKCKVKAGKQIGKLFMTGLLATFLSSVALAADEDVKVKYDAATGTIKIFKADESQVLASYAVGGNISSIDSLGTDPKTSETIYPSGVIAIGKDSKAVQTNNIAIGTDAHAGNVNGKDNISGKIAIGTKTVASGDRSIALGNYSSENEGSYNIVQGNDSIGIGTSTSIFGSSGVSIGRRNIIGVPDPDLVKEGVLTTKSKTKYGENDLGGNSVIVGAYNVAYGNRSNVIGTYSRAMGSNSVAIGSGVQSLTDGAIAIGKGSGYEFKNKEAKYARYWELPPEYKVLKQVLTNDIQGDEKYKKGRTVLPKYENYGAGSSDPGGFIVEGKNALGVGSYTQVRGDSAIGLATGEMTADLSLKDKSEYAKAMSQIMGMEEALYEAKEELEKLKAETGDTAKAESAMKAAEERLATAKKEFREKYLSKYSFVEGEAALGVGRKILAQGDRSMAVGDQAKAISNDAIAYGGNTLANGTNSMAMGGNAHVGTEGTEGTEGNSFNNSMAIGSHTNVQAGNAVALGAFSKVTGENSLALGFGKQDGNNINYNAVSGKDSTLIGSYGNIAGNNSILIGSSGNIANDRVVGLGNNINIEEADPNDQENNTAGSVFLGDHAGYVKDSKRSRSLGEVTLVGSEEKKELTESLSSTKGALRDYTKDFIYIYMLENQDDGTKIGAPIAVRSDFAGGDSTVGVVSVGSTYEQTFKDLTAIKDYHTKVGSLITVPVEVEVEVTKNGIKLGKQNQIRYFAADSTQEEIYADSTLSQADKEKVWKEIQSKTSTPNNTYTVFETRRIQNVAPGLIGVNSTDAINGSQLFATNQMLGNLVGSLKKALGDNVTITPDGQIDTKDEDNTPFTLGWIAKAGSVDGSNGTVAYEVDKAEGETDEAYQARKDKLEKDGYIVDAAKVMTFKAGKNIGLVQKPGELSISTIDMPSFKSVELRGETKDVDGSQVTPVTMLDSSGMQVYTETVTPDGDGTTTTKKVSTTVNNEGVTTDGTVKVTNGKGGDQAKDLVTIGKNVDPNAPAGTDGENGTIGLDGKNGSSATITVDRGTSSLDDTKNIGGTDPKQDINENNPAKMDRITYTTKDKNGKDVITHEVATMDDGLFFSGDSADGKDGNVKNKFDRKLSQETKIIGGVNLGLQADATAKQRQEAITAKLTDGNIGVISDGTDTLTVKLAKQLTGLDSTTYTSPTTKTDDGDDATSTMKVDGNGVRFVDANGDTVKNAPTFTTDGITGGNKTITDVASGIGGKVKDSDKNNANTFLENVNKIGAPTNDISENIVVNAKDLKNLVDTGFKLNTSGQPTDPGATTVRIGDTINVVDGANTKVSAITAEDGTHTFHMDVNGLPMSYVTTDGKPVTKIGDKFYKTEDLENGTPKPNKQPLTDNEVSNNISLLDKTGNTTAAPQIKNVGSGLINNNSAISPSDLLNITDMTNPVLKNAVNVGDLKNVAAAAKTEVTGTGKAIVTNTTAQDGHTIYNVHVDPVVNVVAADGKTQVVRGDDGKYYDPADIENKTFVPDGKGGGNWYNTSDIGDNGQPNTGASVQNINPVDVKNNFVNPNGTGSIVVDNVKSGIGGKVDDPEHEHKNTFIDNINKVGKPANEGGIDKTTVVNAGDLKNLADTPLFFSGDSADGVVAADGTDKNTFSRKLSQETKIVGGVNLELQDGATAKQRKEAIAAKLTDGNIGVISDGTDTLTIKLAKELKDLASVKVSNGKDGKNLVTIGKEVDDKAPAGKDGENGFIGLDGKNGSEAVITIDRGTKSITDEANLGEDPSQPVSGTNKSAKMDRITYTTKGANGDIDHEVATLDDGFMLTTSTDVANSKAPANVKLNNTIKFTDGANTKVSTVTSKDGVHELHVDVTGLPVTYTATKTDAQGNVVGNPVNVSKVGDTYQDATGNKLIKVDNKYYRPDQLVDSNAPNPEVKDTEKANGLTITDSISLVNNNGTTNPTTLKNVGSGLKDANGNATTLDQAVGSNAVNVDDLRTMGKAATTEVTGTGAAEVTKVTGANGQNIYNVHVDKLMTVKPVDSATKVARGGDGKYYDADDIKDKTFVPSENKWYNTADVDATTGKPLEGKSPLTDQPIALDQSKLKNSVVNPNGDGATIVDNVKSGIGGEVKDTSGKNTFIDNINKVGKKNPDGTVAPDAISENTVVNAGDLKNLADTPLFFQGDVSSATGTNNTFSRKLSEKVSIVGEVKHGLADTASAEDKANAIRAKLSDGNIGVISNGTDTLTIKLAKELTDLTSAKFKTVVKNDDGTEKTTAITKVDGSGITITPNKEDGTPDTGKTVSLTDKGLNNGGNKITNVGAGDISENSTDAINGGQLYQYQQATNTAVAQARTQVTGTGAAIVTKTTTDGRDSYNVHVEETMAFTNADGDKLIKGADGKWYKPTDIAGKVYDATSKTWKQVGDDGSLQDLAQQPPAEMIKGADGKWYKPDDIKGLVYNDGAWKKVGEDGSMQEVTPPTATSPSLRLVDADGGTNNTIKLENLASAIAGKVGDDTETTNGNNSFINNLRTVGEPNGITPNAAVTTQDLRNLADTGFKLQTSGGMTAKQAATTVKLGDTVQVVDGKNTRVSTITSNNGVHSYAINVDGLPMSFTDDQGNALVKVGDNFYKASDIGAGDTLVKVGDKLYKSSALDDKGQPKSGATEITASTPAGVSLVDKDGKSTSQKLSGIQSSVADVEVKGTDGQVNQNASFTDKLAQAATDAKRKDNAVNLSDLNEVAKAAKDAQATADKGFNVKVSASGTGVASATDDLKDKGQNIKPGDTFTFEAGDNITLTQAQGKLTISTNNQGIVNNAQLPVAYTTTDKDGKQQKVYKGEDGQFYTVAGVNKDGNIVGKDGNVTSAKDNLVKTNNIIASVQNAEGSVTNPSKLTNVADGTVAKGSKDAVNGGQLYEYLGIKEGDDIQITQVTVNKPDGTTTVINVPTDKAGNPYLTTYNVEEQGEHITNNVYTAIRNMNEQGIKYFHVNAGQDIPEKQASNSEDSNASAKYAASIGYQANVESGAEGGLAIGKGATVTKDSVGSIAIGSGGKVSGKNSISIGSGNIVKGDGSGAFGDPSSVTGDGSYALGNNNTIEANNAFAVGNETKVTADNAVAVGHKTKVTTKNSVALGANAQATQTIEELQSAVPVGDPERVRGYGKQVIGEVSVGGVNEAGEQEVRRITNVAAGSAPTDAVNVSQLNQVGAALHNRINNVAKGAYGGVASAGAMASLPQAYLPGKSMVAAGASHYRGESAVALGASRISDNGKIILKLNASHNTSGNTMVGAGVGYQF